MVLYTNPNIKPDTFIFDDKGQGHDEFMRFSEFWNNHLFITEQ